MKLLLVEDEAALRATVVEALRQNGHVVEVAVNFSQACDRIEGTHYDCALLDLTLPDGDGWDLVKLLQAKDTPTDLVLLTARSDFETWGKELGLQAESYLAKPFHLSELNARLRALAQRQQRQGQYHIVFRELIAWPERHEAQVNDKPLVLTRMEYHLLLYLLANPNRVLTKEAIAEHLCPGFEETADAFSIVYTHFKNLKRKLQQGGATDYIRTFYGVGYRLSTP